MFDKKLKKVVSLFLSLEFLGVNANAYGDISHKEITITALKYTTHRKFLGFDLSWFGSRAFGWRENFKGYLEKGILEGCVLPDIDEAGYLFYGHFYNPVKYADIEKEEPKKLGDNKSNEDTDSKTDFTEEDKEAENNTSKFEITNKDIELDLKSDSALKRMYDHFNKAVDLWKEAENFVKDNNKKEDISKNKDKSKDNTKENNVKDKNVDKNKAVNDSSTTKVENKSEPRDKYKIKYEAMVELGRAMHYLEDMCCVVHTVGWFNPLVLYVHADYEKKMDENAPSYSKKFLENSKYDFRMPQGVLEQMANQYSYKVSSAYNRTATIARYDEFEIACKASSELLYLFFQKVGINI